MFDYDRSAEAWARYSSGDCPKCGVKNGIPCSPVDDEERELVEHSALRNVPSAHPQRLTRSERMNFGHALEALRAKKRVCREGWNGRGMYLMLIEGGYEIRWKSHDGYETSAGAPSGTLPFIAMKTAQNQIVPWLASQTDMLASDWMIVP